jgi:hypothetical protein
MSESGTMPLPCPICGTDLKLTVTTNRNGKHAIGVHCPADGRHFRGFINHRPFVEGALDRLLAAQAGEKALPDGASASAPAGQALQNDNGGPAPAKATRKRRRAG